jgi:MFS family permease
MGAGGAAPPRARAEEAAADLGSAVAAVRARLIPFLFLLYIFAYLDRINVGFAALQMNQALGFSDATYGLGAGIFFLGYTAFEIPSNVILARVGARLWIARIMITWGLVSASMMFVRSAAMFYTLRLLLGLAEAGFFPGIIFYLTQWFPARERARTIAAFMTATLTAGIVGGPLSGALLSMHGLGGLAGWQWLFVLEGVPAVLLGLVVLRVLVEGPEDARWLTARQKAALGETLRAEGLTRGQTRGQTPTRDPGAPRQHGEPPMSFSRTNSTISADQPGLWGLTRGQTPGQTPDGHSVGGALRDRRLWLLAAVYFVVPVALYAFGFFLPQIIQTSFAGSTFAIGVISAVPYIAGSVAMILAGRHSDRTGERRWHVTVAALVSAVGFVAAAFAPGIVLSMLALSIAMAGLASMFGPFWTLATSFVSGVGAAAGIALINSVGNVGGFVGPYALGAIKDATDSFAAGLILIGITVAAGGLLVLASPSE